MKKLPILLCLSALIAIVSSCKLDPEEDAWEYYEDWRNENQTWLHYFNDRNATAGNLSPLYTSTVDIKYKGQLYNDVAFDSSYTQTAYGDSIARSQVNGFISGFSIAMMDMHVGDSCEVLIPYQQGYGSTGSYLGEVPIYPYSNLKFHIKLVDIPGYEKPAR